MTQRPYHIDVMISAKTIAARIEDLALTIRKEYCDTES